MDLTKDEKVFIKMVCEKFNAQKIWIEGVEVNVPPTRKPVRSGE